jgi:hypothetical protein
VALALILDASATTTLGETPALGEGQASAGAQSAPRALLHPWKAAVTLALSRSMHIGTPAAERPISRRAAPFAWREARGRPRLDWRVCAERSTRRGSLSAADRATLVRGR